MLRRIARLVIGLALYGLGCALCLRAGLGVDPWTVLAQGVALHTGVGVGWMTNVIGLVVLALWLPLRQRPGIGTLANVLLVGTCMQGALAILPAAGDVISASAMLLGGILTVAVASAIYIGAGLGAGPRDGLMTGLNARFGLPLWSARAIVEGAVLAIGWALGGTVGIGTIAFAALIGPLVHAAMSFAGWADRRRASHPAARRQQFPSVPHGDPQPSAAVTRTSRRYPSHS